MDITDIALILFIISCIGVIFSIVYLIVSFIKKNNKKKLAIKLLIGFIVIAVGSMAMPAFSGGNDSLNKEERKILKKDYASLTEDEKTTLSLLEVKLEGKTREKYLKNLKRLFIQKHIDLGMSEEEAEKFWDKEEDYRKRKDAGQLTEKEKVEEKQHEKDAEAFNDNVKKYMDAEKTIQDNINKLITSDERFIKSTDKVTVKEENSVGKIIVTVNIYGMYDLRVGEVSAIRNIMVEEVEKVIKPQEIEVKFQIDGKELDTYMFKEGVGWDKEVKSKK